MSLYVVQVRKLAGPVVGYLWRGRVVRRHAHAALYDSPSAARRAAEAALAWTEPGHYCTVRPARRRGA